MNVVYALTRNIYDWIVPSVKSLAAHNKNVRLFIVCEDDEFPIDLPIKPEVINVTNQSYFAEDSINYKSIFKYINLLKVCYASLLPVNKVIHLDVDTIVCKPLDELWKTDMTGKWFGAVQEYRGRYRPFGDAYWNAGVLLLNLQQIRKDGQERKYVEYLNNVKTPFVDQDAWNFYAKDRVVSLDPVWNESDVTRESSDPGIVHYCGIVNWWDNPNMKRVEYLNKYR